MEDTLCQSEGISCAGCCHDMHAYSREGLARLFRHNKSLYSDLAGGRITPEDYEIAVRQFELDYLPAGRRRIESCHFVGFLDGDESRVGCLAHPKANHGRDMRDEGVYSSANFCNDWVCNPQRIYARLNPEQRKAFRDATPGRTWLEPMNTNETIDLMIGLFGDRRETHLNNLYILLGDPPFHGW